MDPKSGRTQYGLIRDDWGNWFGCSNSYPWWHYALEDRYLRRNPYVVFPSPKELLGDEKRAGPVYPASHTPSRFNDYDAANRFTSACSITPYRDQLLGDLAMRSRGRTGSQSRVPVGYRTARQQFYRNAGSERTRF